MVRGFLIWLVSVIAAFAGGHYAGDLAREQIRQRTSIDIGGDPRAEAEISRLQSALDQATANNDALASRLAEAEAAADRLPPLVPLRARIGAAGQEIGVHRGVPANRLTTLTVEPDPATVGEIACRTVRAEAMLVNGLRPKSTTLRSASGELNIAGLRRLAEPGDRLVVDGIVIRCGDIDYPMPDASFPIR